MLFLLALLAAEGLPAQPQLDAALREAVTAACPTVRLTVDPDLTRACPAYVGSVSAGGAPAAGRGASFFASIESYEPAPVAGVAEVTPPSSADRAIAQLVPPACHFNRAGVAAAVDPTGQAVVCALVA